MNTNSTMASPRQDRQLVTAAQWFAGGHRIPYDPDSARVLTEDEVAGNPDALRVFHRVTAATPDTDATWLTLLPGFPDGSYGWAQVDRILGDKLGPRLYVEPVGQGDSDKPRNYPYSTMERADLVEAMWRYHGVRRTVVVTFDYTSLALLELLRRQLERTRSGDTAIPAISAVLMVNGGLFADAHTHPWQGTPLLRTPLGALGMRRAQNSPRVFDTAMMRARMYSRSYRPAPEELGEFRSAVTRRDGAAFLHNAAGFVAEHRRHAAPLGPCRHRRRPTRQCPLLHRRQRGRPVRAPTDLGHPRARTRRRNPGVSRRSPDHQRAPGPPRRGHRRHRNTPRRRRSPPHR